LNDLLDNKVSPIFQLFFVEGMDMPTNIPEASTNQMSPTTQHALAVIIASSISTAPGIPMASPISEDIQLDSAITAQSSTIPVGSTIPVHSNISVHSTIPVQPGIQEASVVPPPVSPYFTPAAPTVLTPTAPIPTPVPG
jgi:hypothetical protein